MSSQLALRMMLGSMLVTACAQDTAMPGYDDPTPITVGVNGSGGSGAAGASSTMTADDPNAMAASGGTTSSMSAPPMGSSSAGGAQTGESTMGSSSMGGSSMGSSSAGGSSMGGSSMGSSSMGSSSMGGSPMGSSGSSGMATPPDPKCDLSGRWLVVQRSVEGAIGVEAAVRNWMYFEFSQSGQNVTTTRGLDCGFDSVPLSAVSGSADLHKSWPTITQKNQMAGRKATIQATASGCTVSFPTYVSVYGSTVSYYKDTSHAMPTTNDMASGSTPGWEDWDADGNPGITYNISGIATGQVYYTTRMTNTWSGSISQMASSFTLTLAPIHEQVLLGYNGSSLITTPSQLSADKTAHFVDFARLDASQATGDDTATCNAVRMLAPMLAPNADAKPF